MPLDSVIEFQGSKPAATPIHKQIPKIALNFTKWKLQQRMVADLRTMADQEEIQQNIAKYTECFDLLDRLGADNCVDPEDFDQEDMNDEMFKNLQIKDIEELFRETTKTGKRQDQDTPAAKIKAPKDCVYIEHLENNKYFMTDEDALLLEQLDSPIHEGEEDQNCMDFEQQMKMYDEMNAVDDLENALAKPRGSSKEGDLLSKFKIQSLEEVTERSEESDLTSHLSYNSIDLYSSDNNRSFDFASEQETALRVKIMDELE